MKDIYYIYLSVVANSPEKNADAQCSGCVNIAKRALGSLDTDSDMVITVRGICWKVGGSNSSSICFSYGPHKVI